jgi:hypothetical protein
MPLSTMCEISGLENKKLNLIYAKKIFIMAAMWAFVTSLNLQKNTHFKNTKFDPSCHIKKIKLALYLQNK